MQETSSPAVRLRQDGWAAWMERLKLGRVADQAEHLGIHQAQLYRILNGSVAPGEQFIAACMAKYDRTFEELFKVVEAGAAQAAS